MKYKDIEFIERKKCCICGCSDLHFIQNIYDYDSNIGDFKLVECPQCKMCYTSPYPTESTLPNLYLVRDTKNFDTKNSLFFEFIKDFLAKIQVSKFSTDLLNPKSRILDFGCGDGRWALAFQKSFPDLDINAVDFVDTPPEKFLKISGKVPKYLTTNEFFNNDDKYDIIFLRHVVEHVENPKLFLSKILNRLTEAGYIYIEVPNIKNGIRLFFNRYLPSYYPPYHLVHFTDENIVNLLKEMNVEYEISHTEMPIMSNLIANMCFSKLNNGHRILGMFLHPLQLLLCIKKHTVIVAKIKKRK